MLCEWNGHRVKDTAKKMNADNHADYIHHVHTYEYDPRDRVTKKTKKDTAGNVLETETYEHDANNNVIQKTVDGTTTTYHYDRNRLLSANIGGTTAAYNYDPFGRLNTVTAAGEQIEKYTYDGFDRVAEHSKLQEDGSTKKTSYVYDPLDRTVSRTEGTKTTDFHYLGLSGQVLNEEVAGEIQKSYQYSPWGERLSMVKHNSDGTEEDSYYGYNPHTDVEVLTDENGNTRATYGYTAYGKPDEEEFTGV
ncbi:YD repeat-containing protein, partial [Melghirimyces profundicolus]